MDWTPNIFRRRNLYNDLAEEMRLHLEERTEQFMREGMSRAQAEQAARRAFGNPTLLAITGIFGMTAHSVSKRMKEFGIRLAVGAQGIQLVRAALGRPLLLLFSGSAAGLLWGVLSSRLLAQIVYLATPWDPLVLGGVILAMAVVGMLATWIPARRALTIDPGKLLRDQ